MWILLSSPDDWEEYKQDRYTDLGLMPGMPVNFGHGPKKVPCLVTALYLAEQLPSQVFCCFVYPEDIGPLLEACGKQGAADHLAEVRKVRAERTGGAAFFRSVAAHHLVFVKLCVDTGLCSKEKFEELYDEALGCVDAWGAGQAARVTDFEPQLGPDIMERLWKPKSDS